MKSKRTCALDLGKRRIGLAIDDELGLYAHPRGILAGGDIAAFLKALREFVVTENVGTIVVGLPLDMRGGEGDAARSARVMAQKIADATRCNVTLWDERLTTAEAMRSLQASEVSGKKTRERIDEAAAVAILQSWLDRSRKSDD